MKYNALKLEQGFSNCELYERDSTLGTHIVLQYQNHRVTVVAKSI
jgi:hypothetical protein